MDPVMMVTLILTLVTKFGPTALEEFQNWRQGCADPQAPTQEEWKNLHDSIKPPDKY